MIRIDPRHSVVWRTPTSVQVGFPRAVVIAELTTATEILLDALQTGTTRETLTTLAHFNSLDSNDVDSFLDLFSPALETAGLRRVPRIGVDPGFCDSSGQDTLAGWAIRALASLGEVRAVRPDDVPLVDPRVSARVRGKSERKQRTSIRGVWMPDAVILTGAWAITPERAGAWLRRDVPHLALIAHDEGIDVTPVVSPGNTPCLLCLEFSLADADNAWVAMVSQLAGRLPEVTSLQMVDALARAGSSLDLFWNGESNRPTSQSVSRPFSRPVSHSFSSRCSCQALPQTAIPEPA